MLRQIHQYLGCFFAPLLLLFTITGAWQSFMLHRAKKDDSFHPPALVAALSEIHMNQRFPTPGANPSSSVWFRWLILLMAAGLVVTTVLGLVMAFQFSRQKWLVGLCLAAGILCPVFLLLAARGFR